MPGDDLTRDTKATVDALYAMPQDELVEAVRAESERQRDSELVQQLAGVIADTQVTMHYAHGPTGFGQDLAAARAVLASGLVIPTSDVLTLAQQWRTGPAVRHEHADQYAAELCALTQQEES